MTSNKVRDFIRSAIASAAFALTLAICATSGANAAPSMKAAISEQATQDSVVLVRDGCGPGMRFSNSRQACVEDFGGGPPRYVEPPRYVAPGCPPGTRFSERMQTCVEMRQVDPGAAIVNGIINGAIGAAVPPGCGPGMRWSNGRGRCVYD